MDLQLLSHMHSGFFSTLYSPSKLCIFAKYLETVVKEGTSTKLRKIYSFIVFISVFIFYVSTV